MSSSTPRFWLIIASRDHIMRGVEGSFCQVNHGKKPNVARMKKGDRVLIYSPKIKYGEVTPCQKFTAVGTVKDDETYQVQQTETFKPWRRNVVYRSDIEEADVRPLIEELSFIRNKEKWGMAFRYGFVKLGEEDFARVEMAMVMRKA